MTEKITVKLEARTLTGKKVAKLRDEGIVPAVVYGADMEPKNVQLLQQDAQRAVAKAGKHSPVELNLDNKTHEAMIKDVEMEPASNYVAHVSFQAISANDVVTAEVPVVIEGVDECPAVKAGYEVQQAIEQVEVRAKASDLPEKIVVPAAGLEKPGDKLPLSAAKLDNITITNQDADAAVATVRAIEEAPADDAAAATDTAAAPAEEK